MTHDHVFLNFADPVGVAVVVVGAIATAIAFVLAFRMTVRPGETEADHPKNTILREDY